LEVKQGEVAWNHAIRKLVTTPNHFSHDGEAWVAKRLMKMSINHTSKLVSSIYVHICCFNLVVYHWQENELRHPPTASKLNGDVRKEKLGAWKPTPTHSRCLQCSLSMNMVVDINFPSSTWFL
jgi:hypothetical protein